MTRDEICEGLAEMIAVQPSGIRGRRLAVLRAAHEALRGQGAKVWPVGSCPPIIALNQKRYDSDGHPWRVMPWTGAEIVWIWGAEMRRLDDPRMAGGADWPLAEPWADIPPGAWWLLGLGGAAFAVSRLRQIGEQLKRIADVIERVEKR